MTLRLFLLQPATVFAARVNQANFIYPLAGVAYDGVTVGAYGDVELGMTIVFGTTEGDDDLGRQRVRKAATADTLYVGRSSRGNHDGEVDLQDNAYIAVLNDYRVWAKIPYIDDEGNVYKDHDLQVGTNTTTPPPVANAGCGMAGTVDSGSGELRVTLPHEANTSFAVAGSIASYAWSLPAGVSLVDGYSLSDSQIQVDCGPGFYWIALTVTDTNGKTHTARVPVLARNPDDDPCIGVFEVENHRITPEGQQLSLHILEDIGESTYPDGTLVMLWEGEPSGPADRSQMIFTGWHHTDPATVTAGRTGLLRDTTLECLDVAGKLDVLPAFSQSVEGKDSPSVWTEMSSPNMDKYLHYLLHWHSTALELADWTWSGTTIDYPFVILGSEGETLFDQVERRAQALVPNYHLVCNRLGQLAVKVDPMLQDVGDRTATVQATLTEADWSDIRWTHRRHPEIHWLRSNAVLAHATEIAALFCIAPGKSPSQGPVDREQGEQLAKGQSDLNVCEGHRYARINAPEGHFDITLTEGDDLGIEPADYSWVQLTVSSATAAQRGLAFTTERGLPLELSIRYDHRREGLVKSVGLVWERETSGTPAVTEEPPKEIEPPEWEPPSYPPPIYPGPEPPDWGAGKMAIAHTSGSVLARTPDLLAADGPVWTNIWGDLTGGLTGFVYVQTGDSTVGGWVITTTGVWWCDNVMADTPTWTCKLTLEEAQAAAPNGYQLTEFHALDAWCQDPDFLVISPSYNVNQDNCCMIYTTDRGTSWNYPAIVGGFTPWHGVKVDQDSGHIYALRIRVWGEYNGHMYMWRSTDTAQSWSNRGLVHQQMSANWSYCIHPPLLAPTGTIYLSVVKATGASYSTPGLVRSTNGGASWTHIFGSGEDAYRSIEGFTYDADDLLAVEGDALCESVNAGVSFEQLTTAVAQFGSDTHGDKVCGWPGDRDLLIWPSSTVNGWPAPEVRIVCTKDGGATWQSLMGNWYTLYDNYYYGGLGRVGVMLLPRVGANA